MNLKNFSKNIQTYRKFSFFNKFLTNNVKKEIKAIDREPVTFVTSKKEKFIDRIYVWGHTGTGSLGEPQFLRPYANKTRVSLQRKPWRLRWVDRISADVKHIACGNGFSLISITDSQHLKGEHLFGTGINTSSQIGVHETFGGSTFQYIIEPAKIELPFSLDKYRKLKILDISCGRIHSVVLTNYGVVTFGSNSYGQLGRPIIENESYYGNKENVQNITKFLEFDSKDDEIISVKAGQDHTCFLTKSGQVLTCGWSADGQLGQEIYTLNAIPKQVSGDIKGVKIAEIATKCDFVLALDTQGELYGWGNNEYKQLAMSGSNEPQIGVAKHLKLPNYIKKPVLKIAASGTHCMLIDSDRKVWVWGFGLLGKGPKCDEIIEPQQIPDTLFGKYAEISHTMERQPIAVTCGLNSSAVTLDDGSLYMWGKNKYGNLGTGDELDYYLPIRINIPAAVKKIDCGPDHTLTIAKTYI